MKNIVWSFVASLFIVSCAGSNARANLIIADNSKSTFTIVVPAKAPDSVTLAAQELQLDVAEATQAKLPIQKDNEKVTGPIISLGSTNQAKAAGITADGIADSGFRIVTKNDNLYIIGLDTAAKQGTSRKGFYEELTPQPDLPGQQYTKDGGFSNGTANGVYTFLEEYLNVRWLMPGDLGRDVPTKSTFTIPDIDRTKAPEFIYRRLDMLGAGQLSPAIYEWQLQQKLGISFDVKYNHNWKQTVPPDLYKTHPKWFAMINEKRVPPTGNTYKLETTNPDLVRYYAERAITALKADPRAQTYSLSPTDGSAWSESPESKALYDMPTPDRDYLSVTPLVLKFYRDVSEIVKKEYPQGKLAGWLYSQYIDPPTKGDKTLPDNFIPFIAPSFDYGFRLYKPEIQKKFDNIMDGWGKIAPPIWFYYDVPNAYTGKQSAGLVTPPGTGILNHIFPSLVKNHIKGSDFTGSPAWSQAALANYIDAKLLWDPKLDANDVQRDWLTRAYGSQAGSIMEEFYQKLDGWFSEYYMSHDQYFEATARESLFKEVYGPHYVEMEKLFMQAKAQPMTKKQKERLHLLEMNMTVLQWRLRNAEYLPTDFVSRLERSGPEIVDLMLDGRRRTQDRDKAFDLFPILWYPSGQQPKRTPVKISLNHVPPTTGEDADTSKINSGYIQLYAAQAGEVSMKISDVHAGSAFVWYSIWRNTGDDFVVQDDGIFLPDSTLTFKAKADTLYLLRVMEFGVHTGWGTHTPTVDYNLFIKNAAVTKATLQKDTLNLQGKENVPLYVYVTGRLKGHDNAEGVTISTQTPIEAVRSEVLRQHAGSKVLLSLDKEWKFNTDPDRTGLQQNIIAPDYNDTSWKSLTAADTWQSQGFPDYHGTAWYRKSINVPKHKGKVLLFFGAVDGDAVVYVNGQKVGEHLLNAGNGWDKPFTLDITKAVRSGKNAFAVQVIKDAFVGGIYKGVALLEMPADSK